MNFILRDNINRTRFTRFLPYAIPAVVYVSVFLCFFPYIYVDYDALIQFRQALGISAFNGWQPIFTTLLYALPLAIFKHVGAVFALQTILILLAIFQAIHTLNAIGLPNKGALWFSVVMSILPVFSYSVGYVIKDVVSMAFFLGFISTYAQIIYTRKTPVITLLLLTVWTLCFALSRHGAMVIIIPSGIFLCAYFRKKVSRMVVKRIVIAFLAVVFGCFGFAVICKYPLKAGSGVSSKSEAMSVPLQMLNRIMNNENADITAEEQEWFVYITGGTPTSHYSQRFADNIKGLSAWYVNENFSEFVKYWAAICVKNPLPAIEAVLIHTNWFWDLDMLETAPNYMGEDTVVWNATAITKTEYIAVNQFSDSTVYFGVIYLNFTGFLPWSSDNPVIIDRELLSEYYDWLSEQGRCFYDKEDFIAICESMLNHRSGALLKIADGVKQILGKYGPQRLLQQPATWFYILLANFAVMVYKNKRKRLMDRTGQDRTGTLLYVPILFYYAYLFAFSPIAYMRYVMPIAFATPLIVFLSVFEYKNIKAEENINAGNT